MKRRLFNLAAAMSLVLCVASAVLWTRSLQWGDVIGWNLGQRHGFLKSDEAAIWLCWDWVPGDTQYGYFTRPDRRIDYGNYIHSPIPVLKWQPMWFTAGHAIVVNEEVPGTTFFNLIVPHWALAVITGSLPLIWWRQWRRKRVRTKLGLCVTCGYDLRASPERCPECGTKIQPRPEIVDVTAASANHPMG